MTPLLATPAAAAAGRCEADAFLEARLRLRVSASAFALAISPAAHAPRKKVGSLYLTAHEPSATPLNASSAVKSGQGRARASAASMSSGSPA